MHFLLSTLLAAPISAGVAAATLATETNYVTQFLYEEINVLVDTDGVPYSTQTVSASTPIPQVVTSSGSPNTATSFSQPAATLPAATPASTHSHAAATENYAYISPTLASASSTTTSSSTPATTWTPPTPTPPATTSSSTSSSSTSSTSPTISTTTSSAWTPPTTSAAPTTPTTSSSSSQPAPSSTSGDFTGDATYYDVGLGACGFTNTDSELVAALNVDQFNQFGSMSNGNPACGKQATLNYNGKSVTVEIVDKCMGCKYGDLDLSPAAFEKLADESAGRIKMTWSFV